MGWIESIEIKVSYYNWMDGVGTATLGKERTIAQVSGAVQKNVTRTLAVLVDYDGGGRLSKVRYNKNK